MAKFIEVTNDCDGKKMLINLAWVEEICQGATGLVTIYFAFNCPDCIEQDYIHVKESYEEIKRKVGTEDGK